MPIISGNLDLVKDFEGYVQNSFKNWLPQYKRIFSPLGYTIRNNNNKSISIFLFSREIPRLYSLTPLITATIIHSHAILKEKGVIVDVLQAQTKNVHISVKNKDLDKVFNEGESFEVFLNRNCAKILSADEPREAKAWVDSSPYLGVETNDIQYKENLIMMPERVNRLTDDFYRFRKEALDPLTEQIKLHLEVQRETLKTLKKIQESLDKKQ